MKKIYMGLLSIAVVLAVVGASAYALYTSSVTVTGMAIATGTSGLGIQGVFSGIGIYPTNAPTNNLNLAEVNNGNPVINKLNPGESDHGEFILTNSGTVDLNLKGQLTSAGEGANWDELKDLITLRVYELEAGGARIEAGHISFTLAQWFNSPRTLPGSALVAGKNRSYDIVFELSSSAGNSIQGMSLPNITFLITGTQVQ